MLLSFFRTLDAGDWGYATDAEHEAGLQENAAIAATQDQAVSRGCLREIGAAETGA